MFHVQNTYILSLSLNFDFLAYHWIKSNSRVGYPGYQRGCEVAPSFNYSLCRRQNILIIDIFELNLVIGCWLSGLVVWFSLRVREVPGSIPGWAQFFFALDFYRIILLKNNGTRYFVAKIKTMKIAELSADYTKEVQKKTESRPTLVHHFFCDIQSNCWGSTVGKEGLQIHGKFCRC